MNFNPISYYPSSPIIGQGTGFPSGNPMANPNFGAPVMSSYTHTEFNTNGFGMRGGMPPMRPPAQMPMPSQSPKPAITNTTVTLLSQRVKQMMGDMKAQTLDTVRQIAQKRGKAVSAQRAQDKADYKSSFGYNFKEYAAPTLAIVGGVAATAGAIIGVAAAGGTSFGPIGTLVGAGVGLIGALGYAISEWTDDD